MIFAVKSIRVRNLLSNRIFVPCASSTEIEIQLDSASRKGMTASVSSITSPNEGAITSHNYFCRFETEETAKFDYLISGNVGTPTILSDNILYEVPNDTYLANTYETETVAYEISAQLITIKGELINLFCSKAYLVSDIERKLGATNFEFEMVNPKLNYLVPTIPSSYILQASGFRILQASGSALLWE